MGLPGLRGTEHIGFTVPDLDEAVAFFTEVLGCEYFFPIGPFRDPGGTWFRDNLDLDPRTEVPRGCLMRCGNGSNFEIFEFEAPDQRREMPKMSDWGGVHLAFYVDDLELAIAYLEERGVRVLGGAKDEVGPNAGEGAAYAHFLSPWGMLLELVSYPNGKQYMEGRDRVLWRPQEPSA